MFNDHNPFWFASEKLLADLLRAEIHSVTELFARHPDLPEFFDLPEATAPQRVACFSLLAHCTLRDTIYDTFAGRYEQSPSLGDEEQDVLRRTRNLFASDAPAWVLGVNEMAELLPSRIFDALPEPLHRGGFIDDNSAEAEAIKAAASEIGSVQQIQALSRKVLDQQLQRLQRRWTADISAIGHSPRDQHPRAILVTSGEQKRRMNKRKGWEQKAKLYSAIQNALNRNPMPQGIEFCAELDKRHAPPLYDWVKASEWPEGLTWKEAWANRRLRKKIRRVRQEAMKRR